MSNEKTSHIMFVKEQVLRFAAAIKHTHVATDITDLDNQYAPKNHKSSNSTYGVGDKNNFGHVKVDEVIDSSSTNPVQNSKVKEYVDGIKTTLTNSINALIKFTGELNEYAIVKSINSSSTHAQVPTAQAVWSAITSYKDLLKGVDLAQPKSVNQDINTLRDAGYYLQTGNRHFSYGGETIYYTNALIRVEKQSNRVIQHVYATSKVTSNGTTTYKINGSEYTRWGTSATDWKAWHVAHKPYTKTVRACHWGPGVDSGSVVVYENTAGFIIHWDQTKQDDDRYPISADLYEYAKVCDFEPPLPIKGPYVFGNLIGRCDFRISSGKMEIRSNVSKGGRIIEMHETFFVPRNQ